MKIWVTGGYFDDSGECFVEEVDLAEGTHHRLLSFVPEEKFRVPSKGFTGARWFGEDQLFIASFSAVWHFDVRDWTLLGCLHQPDFNDLHDIHIDDKNKHLYVCNTGLDSIEVFDLEGTFLGRHAWTPAWLESARMDGRFVTRESFPRILRVGWGERSNAEWSEPDGSYYKKNKKEEPFSKRFVRDYAHPNHVTSLFGHLAVTMLATKEIRCWRTHQKLISFDGYPHDACWCDDLLWATCTNGWVTAWSPQKDTGWLQAESYDTSQSGHIGWCRGLLVNDRGMFVGLTKIEGPPHYPWREEPPEQSETSVLWIERGSGRLLGCVDLTDQKRRTKIFSLIRAA